MDSNEVETQVQTEERAEELNKMRSNSSSPSNLSVASSGSPLVRNQSNASGKAQKRPAPTSIAAAQLQCQLEFVNKMQANPIGRPSELGINKKFQQHHRQKVKLQQSSKMQMVLGNSQVLASETNSASSLAGAGDDERLRMKLRLNKKDKKADSEKMGETGKSFGYVFAKSIAFRAHRFNEFWSANKMRFMNLACLLMILSCLATILLFTGSSDGGNTIGIKSRKSPLLSSNEELDAESVELLESQPLQSKQALEDSSLANLEQLGAGRLSKRKPSEVASELGEKGGEQAVGFTPDSPSLLSDLFGQPIAVGRREWPTTQSSLFDPVLSRILNDLESGSLFKTIRRAAELSSNGTAPASIFSSKPIIRRNSNGATIIISSAGFGNDSTPERLQLPSLLEKILPAMLKSSLAGLSAKPATLSSFDGASLDKNDSSKGGFFADQIPLATATITIGDTPSSAEQFFAPSSSLMNPLMARHLNPFSPIDPLFNLGRSRAHSRVFISRPNAEPLMGASFGPFATFAAPPFPLAPPAGLLSMILRSSANGGQSGPSDDFDTDHWSPFRPTLIEMSSGKEKEKVKEKQRQQPLETTTINPSNNVDNQSTTIVQPTTSQTNSTSTNQTIAAAEGANSSTSSRPTHSAADPIKSADSEVELFDVGRHLARQATNGNRLHQMQARTRPSANSMSIFGSDNQQAEASNLQLPVASIPFAPFMHSPMQQHQPHLIFMGAQEGAPLSPMLRSILGNVMMGIAASDGSDESRAGEQVARKGYLQRQAQSSNSMPNWSSLASELEEELAGLGGDTERSSASSSWDEPALAARSSRARHRSASGEFDPASVSASAVSDASELVANIQQLDASATDPHHPTGGFISGTIRQTIRGPGMSVERIIELPSTAMLAQQRAMQQVEPGVRSQSLSRMDGAEEDEESRGEISLLPAGQRQQSSSYGNGFFGRLLSDLARRGDSPADWGQHHNRGRAQSASAKSHHRPASFSDDLEDLDVEGDSGELQHEESPKPKRRSNTGWMRLRAPGSERRSEPSELSMELARNDDEESNNNEQVALQQRHKDHLPSSLPVFVEPHRQQQQVAADHNLVANESAGKHEREIWRDRPTSNPSLVLPANARQLEPIKLASNSIVLRQQHSPAPAQQQPAPAAAVANGDNPFTSPSSPLFGFPSSAGSAVASLAAAAALPSPKENSHRQQRSFVYHSNHELAPQQQFAPALAIQERSEDRSEARKQNEDMVSAPFQPASIVMGRRLDDEPSHADQENQFKPDQGTPQMSATLNHYLKGL